MIVFCDTPALVKLFVEEAGSDAVVAVAVAQAAEAVAVSRLAWVEAMSALARRAREVTRDGPALAQARQAFAERWPSLLVVEVGPTVIERAGDCVEAFALRAYDGVQLAALQTLRLAAGIEIRLACFDSRLLKAAGVLGIAAA